MKNAKLLFLESYAGEIIGEMPLSLAPSIEVLNETLSSDEHFFRIKDSINLSTFSSVEFYGLSSIELSYNFEGLNYFEIYSYINKILGSKKELEDILGNQILINDFSKDRDKGKVEIEAHIDYEILNISIPSKTKDKIKEGYDYALNIQKLNNRILNKIKDLSKNVKSFPKPDIHSHHKRKKVFLSHSSKDKVFTKKLLKDLNEAQIDTWYDEDDILVGQDFIDQIKKGIKESDFLILIISSNFVQFGPWAKEEYKIALNDQISNNITKILPVLINDCEIPDFLKFKHFADFRYEYESGLSRLTNSIRKIKK